MGKTQNRYSGWTIDANTQVDTIPAEAVTAESFYDDYVKARKPVVLRSGNADFLKTEFSNAALAAAIGDEIVEVEVKVENGYGNSNVGERKKVRFTSDFLRSLREGSTYLTTQKVEDGDNGEPLFFAPKIVRKLIDAGSVPGFLPVAGNLVLDQINIWMGSTDRNAPTSSGLHHDFHDNFYFVIRGKKTFKLQSPEKLGKEFLTHGCENSKATVVYPNGLVSYSGNEIREDGAPVEDVLAWKAQLDPEQYQDAYEERLLMNALKHNSKPHQQPLHFSTMREAPKATPQVNLTAGDILYLPAGFFHEVLSANDDDNNGHLVFNYWFHPPASNGRFKKPYPDSFWAKYAADIERAGEEAEMAEHQEMKPVRKRPAYKPRPLFKYFSRAEVRRFLLKHAIRKERQ